MTPQLDVPPSLRLATERFSTTRGRAQQLRRALEQSQIPALLVDNERRYIDANAAARLIFRMPLKELRRNRIDDLTAEHHLPRLWDRWAQLVEHGSVGGHYLVTFRDGSTLWLFYAAIANVLPARHLIVYAPADWPGDELEAMQPPIDGERHEALSPRQFDVLQLIAAGLSAGEIASELSISEATVRAHVRNLLTRLGAHNRAHAVALATARGMLGDPLPDLA